MQIHTVLHTPLTFPISQRVLKIFYSFLVQIISIFYSGFISNKIIAARATRQRAGDRNYVLARNRNGRRPLPWPRIRL